MTTTMKSIIMLFFFNYKATMPENPNNQHINNTDEISITNFRPASVNKDSREYFFQGLYYLYNNKISEARDNLIISVNNTEPMNVSYFEHLSYLGLAEVLTQESRGGLNRCYEALNGFSNIPDLYINLAKAELSLGDRRRSILTIEKCLKNIPDCEYAKPLQDCMGKKRIINHRNNIVGRLFRKKKNQCLSLALDKVFRNVLTTKLESYIQKRN